VGVEDREEEREGYWTGYFADVAVIKKRDTYPVATS
jgi:hypothetical protein